MSGISKRLSIAAVSVILALSLVSSAVLAAPVTVRDVPKDHWAYEAVNLLVEKGYMGVYEGGEFCGDDPVNRYLLAFVTAKLLHDVEAGRTSLSEDDMRIVRETSTILREQLAVITARLKEVEDATDLAISEAAIAKNTTAEMSLKYMQLERAVEEERKQLLAEIEKSASASDQKLTAVFGDLKKQNQEVETRLGQEIAEIMARADSVESLARTTASDEAEARAELETRLTLSLDKIREDQETYVSKLNALGLRLGNTEKALAATRAWAEDALGAESAARQGAVVALTDQLTAAIDGERGSREAAHADLVGQADALSVSLDREAAARKASESRLSARQDELESSLNLKIDSAIEAERALRASELDELVKRLESITSSQDELEQATALSLAAGIEAERSAREAAYSGLMKQVDGLSLCLDRETEARKASELHISARQDELESSLSSLKLRIDSMIEAERKEREAADIANQEEAKRILAEIASARADMADLERRTAEADAAIIVALEAQQSEVSELGAGLAQLANDVRSLQDYAANIELELRQMSARTGQDYASQQGALDELRKSLEQASSDLSEAIKANSAEDLKTSGRVLQNTMRIQDVVRQLETTAERLDQTDAAVREANDSIEEITAALNDIETRLASIDRLLEGSVDELARRFSDELVAERWEAEMREVKLQSMIEELQTRVERLEGEKDDAGAKKGSAGVVLAVLGVIAAVAAIAIGGGSK
ncbi:MAG: S-layer homology domain-containing protein [Firmicutes bacterium]|nr:S-layer homology domain-containing protein [Bacillota bacterium]MDD4792104.1 S-layer homology domain-containing protein [Bacillota bacterium]